MRSGAHSKGAREKFRQTIELRQKLAREDVLLYRKRGFVPLAIADEMGISLRQCREVPRGSGGDIARLPDHVSRAAASAVPALREGLTPRSQSTLVGRSIGRVSGKLRDAWGRWREKRRQYQIERAVYKQGQRGAPGMPVDSGGNPRIDPPQQGNIPL